MRCCARGGVRRVVGLVALVLFTVGAGGVAGQERTGAGPFRGGGTGTDGDAAARVGAAVAARWGVAASEVRVEPTRGAEWPEAVREIRLLGAGADGSWVVAFTTASGEGSLVIRAGIETDVVVAAHDIARGTTLDARDIAVRRDVRWGAPSSRPTRVEAGWVARRRLTAGDVLDDAAVEPPIAVRPGEDVQIVWSSGTVSIALNGRAAGRASIGQRVHVRAGTGRRLEGIVIADGIVRVGPEGREP